MAPADGPCQADDDCEVRPDPYTCDVVAAVKHAPRPAPSGGCGGRPAADARCATALSRCVLEDPNPTSLVGFNLVLACETHGTALTTTTTSLRSTPPTLIVVDQAGERLEISLDDADLEPLSRLLGQSRFSALLAATPPPDPAHPGMTLCRVDLHGPGVTVEGKLLTAGRGLPPELRKTQLQLHAELAALRTKLPRK